MTSILRTLHRAAAGMVTSKCTLLGHNRLKSHIAMHFPLIEVALPCDLYIKGLCIGLQQAACSLWPATEKQKHAGSFAGSTKCSLLTACLLSTAGLTSAS